MLRRKPLTIAYLLTAAPFSAFAGLITAVPGPDDQGGMLMPMVSIHASAGTGTEPTAGSIHVMFSPASTPELRPLQHWSPGNWFAEDAAWRGDLGSPEGVGGTPAANAGSGALFNNQYGFMFMAMGTMMSAFVPSGQSLGIRLDEISSPDMNSFNYGNAANRWDQVFSVVDSQVLWSGSMWHNYFTLPATAAPGTYTAIFEIFIADTPFTGTTGFAQYDAVAQDASANPAFDSAFVTYHFTVVPEPRVYALFLGLAGLCLVVARRVRGHRKS